ncbi:MAG: hypothetical protein AABY97_07200 [Chloroflexota bacterium]
MKREAVNKITRKVVGQFPEMDGVQPAIRRQEAPGNGRSLYLLTYKGQAQLPGGKSLRRIVRVVADDEGRVIRISTSR